MAEEYYVRPPDSDSARGPFDLDKLVTLAEAGQVTRETLYYDERLESWAAIGSNDELELLVFPKQKKLTLKAKDSDSINSLNANEDELDAVTVDDLLAAAEGDSEETRHLKEVVKWQNRAASLAVPVLTIVCLVSALTYIYPSWSIVQRLLDGEPNAIAAVFQTPLLILGALDLLFTICLLLSATEIYPLLRFRALIGFGFFGILFWAHSLTGDPTGLPLLGCVSAYGLGAYTCTLTLNFKLMLTAGITSTAGALGFAYFTTLAPLLAG